LIGPPLSLLPIRVRCGTGQGQETPTGFLIAVLWGETITRRGQSDSPRECVNGYANVESWLTRACAAHSALQPPAHAPRYTALSLSAESHLFHPKLNGLHRVWWIHGVVIFFIRVDQCEQNVERIAFRGIFCGPPELLNVRESAHIIRVCFNGTNIYYTTSASIVSYCAWVPINLTNTTCR
jgi:hypothetical protein